MDAMLSRRTPYEGLLLADQEYLQWLDIDRDIPPHLRQALRQWRAGLLPANPGPDYYNNILSGIRQLRPAKAHQHAMGLLAIATTISPAAGALLRAVPNAWCTISTVGERHSS
ncbi:MAG: hypothetical protein IIB77_11235 [Proteobacteria bacterium]|nr:hypothetical protein [Pseudomonadota bacterium]